MSRSVATTSDRWRPHRDAPGVRRGHFELVARVVADAVDGQQQTVELDRFGQAHPNALGSGGVLRRVRSRQGNHRRSTAQDSLAGSLAAVSAG